MSNDFSIFEEKLSQLNLSMSEHMKQQFSVYYDLLIEWNRVMNLTAITEFNEVVEKHFLDSVALGAYLKLDNKWKVADIGTGAGFPGIPLKILFPQLHILLADSLNKRVRFLNEVILQLKLENIEAVHCRAEELAHKNEYREQYDFCVSRAVANLSCLSEYCLPFVRTGGIFIAYKSVGIEKEVEGAKKAIQILGGELKEVVEFQLPDTEYQRSFIFVNKIRNTSKKYPRKAGMPAREPL